MLRLKLRPQLAVRADRHNAMPNQPVGLADRHSVVPDEVVALTDNHVKSLSTVTLAKTRRTLTTGPTLMWADL